MLTKDAPLGDLVFGIDNSFASRAVDEGVASRRPRPPDAFEGRAGRRSTTATSASTWTTPGSPSKGLAEPVTLEDLTKPEYKDLLVVPNAVTSSPGLSFLLATVGAFGEDGWVDYWTALKANGLKVADGWSDAYYTDFSGGGGDGPRPIVLSYASSPPFTVPEGGTEPTTGALLDTCFRQIEYAGVLEGAANPDGAQKLLDFLLSDEVQDDIPVSMYMYPVSPTAHAPRGLDRVRAAGHRPVRRRPGGHQQEPRGVAGAVVRDGDRLTMSVATPHPSRRRRSVGSGARRRVLVGRGRSCRCSSSASSSPGPSP